jgi:hypothetical protein
MSLTSPPLIQYASRFDPLVELMPQIVDYLIYLEHVRTRSVCRAWYHKANSVSVVSRVEFSTYHIRTDRASIDDRGFFARELPKITRCCIQDWHMPRGDVFSTASRLHTLELETWSTLLRIDLAVLSYIPNLKHLRIVRSHLNYNVYNVYNAWKDGNPVRKLEHIESIDVDGVALRHNFNKFFELLLDTPASSMKKLRLTDLGDCSSYNLLVSYPELTSLTLSGGYSTELSLVDLAKAMPKLIHLDLTYMQFNYVIPFSDEFRLTHLQRLDISQCGPELLGYSDVLTSLVRLDSLEVIKARHTDVEFTTQHREMRQLPLLLVTCGCHYLREEVQRRINAITFPMWIARPTAAIPLEVIRAPCNVLDDCNEYCMAIGKGVSKKWSDKHIDFIGGSDNKCALRLRYTPPADLARRSRSQFDAMLNRIVQSSSSSSSSPNDI